MDLDVEVAGLVDVCPLLVDLEHNDIAITGGVGAGFHDQQRTPLLRWSSRGARLPSMTTPKDSCTSQYCEGEAEWIISARGVSTRSDPDRLSCDLHLGERVRKAGGRALVREYKQS